MSSDKSSRSEKEVFHFFNELILHERLSELREDFTTPSRKGKRHLVHYDLESDSRVETRLIEATQEWWEESSTSYTRHLDQQLKPAFDKVVAHLDEDYRSKDTDEGAKWIGRYYLNQLGPLKEGLSKFEKDVRWSGNTWTGSPRKFFVAGRSPCHLKATTRSG